MVSDNVKLVFVILHYKNIDDTLECIKSIKKIHDAYRIVVVDNNSGIVDDDKTLANWADDLIISQENLGYANGNNLGVSLARKKYNPDFVAVINNDTLIFQDDFIDKIINTYKRCQFDALGPKIITNDGDSVNPFPAYRTLGEIDAAIKKSNRLIKIYESKFKRFFLRCYIDFKHIIKKPKHLKNATCYMEDVSLHGCAIVFSKKYLEKYKDCFFKGTFLYHEEEFLEYRRKRDKLKFIYDPSIEIFHKEGSSLNYNYDDNLYKKLIFREKNVLKSLETLKKIIKQNKKI